MSLKEERRCRDTHKYRDEGLMKMRQKLERHIPKPKNAKGCQRPPDARKRSRRIPHGSLQRQQGPVDTAEDKFLLL